LLNLRKLFNVRQLRFLMNLINRHLCWLFYDWCLQIMNILKIFILIDLNCAFNVVKIVTFISRYWIRTEDIVFDLLIICDLFQLWSNYFYFILYLLIVLAVLSVIVHLCLFPFLFSVFVLVYLYFLNAVLFSYILYKYQFLIREYISGQKILLSFLL